MRDLGVDAELLGGRRGVATTDNGDRTALRSLGHCGRHGLGADGELLEFEDATRTVPDHRAGLGGGSGVPGLDDQGAAFGRAGADLGLVGQDGGVVVGLTRTV